MKPRRGILRYLVIIAVRIYRNFISPFLGSNCRYYPSCSAYALVSFTFLPIHKALYYTVKRVLSCSPYSEGGVDMPPGLSEKEVMDYLKKKR
ncbi:MAG: membrane protein insertion efficiency factor YidD [Spirochaetia bacterium]|nr:membrane protein insertion efficiency factor YidD [Spirochaetia bacterium]